MGSVPPQLSIRETIPVSEGDVAVGVGAGGQYLVVEMAGVAGPYWMCAPVSDRAVECVRSGQASPWSVLHHSSTGTVEIYETRADGSLDESVVLCTMLEAHLARIAA
jgi:hypothetical protein